MNFPLPHVPPFLDKKSPKVKLSRPSLVGIKYDVAKAKKLVSELSGMDIESLKSGAKVVAQW